MYPPVSFYSNLINKNLRGQWRERERGGERGRKGRKEREGGRWNWAKEGDH